MERTGRTAAGRVLGQGGELGVELLGVEGVLLHNVSGCGRGEGRERQDNEGGERRRDHDDDEGVRGLDVKRNEVVR